MMGSAALLCVASLLEAVAGIALDNDSIRPAVAAWISDSTAAEAAYGHISTWDTSGVTDMSYLFCAVTGGMKWGSYTDGCNHGASFFNDNIGAWDTSGVTWMAHMFYGASAFNQDIGGWAVHSVRNMEYMFFGAKAFNQDIGDWAVDSVREMSRMFLDAESFNQALGSWRVDNVEDMGRMFDGASAFDQDLGWCVGADVSLRDAFYDTPCESAPYR
jgi:hypothetical protein